MKKQYVLLFSLVLLMGAWGCSPGEKENKDEAPATGQAKVQTGSLIPFPPDEGAPGKNNQASLQKMKMTKKIHCQGVVKAHPRDMAVVTPPMKGFVRQMNHQTGDRVKKGEIVAKLSHPGYLKLQQEYLSAKSHLDYYRQDYKRQGELAVDEAAPLKKVQQAQARFEDYQARVKSMEKQLQMLHIDPEKLKKGNQTSTIGLQAPISGTLTRVDVKQGDLAKEERIICHIINQNHNRLELDVHERHSNQIHTGQNITFHRLSDTSHSYTTQVKEISNYVDPNSYSFSVRAPLSHLDVDFKHGRHIEAYISVGTQNVLAMPEEALVTIEDKPHALVIKEKGYLPVLMKTGASQKGFVHIKNPETLSGEKFVLHPPPFLE